jgi:hypothetical protein
MKKTLEEKAEKAVEVYREEFFYKTEEEREITYSISLKNWCDSTILMEMTCSIDGEKSPVLFYLDDDYAMVYSVYKEYEIGALARLIENLKRVKKGEMYIQYTSNPSTVTHINLYKDHYEEEIETDLSSIFREII